MCNEYIKGKVNDLIKEYGILAPDELARELGIMVIEMPLGKIWGMYKYQKRNKVIYLNTTLSEFQKRFVLTHEIGHSILHPYVDCFFINKTGYISKIKTEYEANLFASEYLIRGIDTIYLENYSINQLAAIYKVPIELIEFKFRLS